MNYPKKTGTLVLFLIIGFTGISYSQPSVAPEAVEVSPVDLGSVTPVTEQISARCSRVLLGNQIEILLTGGKKMKVVYLGVELPDSKDLNPVSRQANRQAFALNREWIENQVINLEIENPVPDKGGRYSAYVFADKVFVNAELIRRGYARVADEDFQLKGYFLKKQEQAKAEKLGIWANETTTEAGSSNLPAYESDSFFESHYVASKNSKVFHRPNCEWAKKIKDYNRIEFKSRAEALASGRRPCRTCKP